MNPGDGKRPSMRRHARDCGVCSHPQREEIERAFVSWESPSQIAKTYRVHRSTLYLHAAATGLLEAREKNVKAALAHFIERCARVRPTATAFVNACVALSKINSEGQTFDRVSVSSLDQAFEGFSRGELEEFAKTGILPEWYKSRLAETRNTSGERLQ